MGMKITFYESTDLEASVNSIDEFVSSISSNSVSIHVVNGEVVRFVKDLLKMKPIIQLKNCRFAFNNGTSFVEVDGKGNVKDYESGEIPEWYESPIEIVRAQWIMNNGFSNLTISEYLSAFIKRFPDLNSRREYADMLFDLQLNKIGILTKFSLHKIRGNTARKTTKSKVTELHSFEIFCQFYERLKTAVYEDKFPTMKILLGHDNLNEVPSPMKGAVRTWFKGITGQLPPNAKRVDAGNVVLFCAPIREKLFYIEEIGLETYYGNLSKAISETGKDTRISDFNFSSTKK